VVPERPVASKSFVESERPIKRDVIDLDHGAGKRLTFRIASLDLLSADPASVELTTPRNMIFPA
jgi:hypothetical protein